MSTNPDGTLKTLTAEERKEFDKERASYFKGSIAVMVIYGTFILALAILGIFSPSGRAYIFEQNFAFTVTFIAGTLIVITLMLIQLLSYAPPKKGGSIQTDALSCPDYWQLNRSTSNMLLEMNPEVRKWGEYYCEPQPSVIGIGTTYLVGIGTTTPLDTYYTNMVNKFNYVGGVTTGGLIDTTSLMKCNRIYPDYMNYEDTKAYPDKPNTLRCKFIEQCTGTTGGKGDKISWSSVCP